MIEWAMLLGIRFLAGCLLALPLVPLIHARAVRLTTRRFQALTPLSVTEMEAEKDQLRAEFAMTVRRLEISLDEAKAKAADRLAEVGKKSLEVQRLKVQLEERAVESVLSTFRSLPRNRAA